MDIPNPANTSQYNTLSFGGYGFRVVDDTFTPIAEESYAAIQVIEEAEVTAEALAGDDLTSETLAVGLVVYGVFSSVSVASGKVLAYISNRP